MFREPHLERDRATDNVLASRLCCGLKATAVALALTIFGFIGVSNAQTALEASSEVGADPSIVTPEQDQPNAAQMAQTQSTIAAPDEDFAPMANDENVDSDQQTDLETGLPMHYLLTPFHWGDFSMVSLTTYQGYSSNPQFQQAPIGSSITSVSGLVLFSKKLSGWTLTMQYQPFLWFASTRTFHDFVAASTDLRHDGYFNGTWRWTVGDHFRYSPTHSTDEQKGFVAGPGGFTFGNAFLSSGRNLLGNSLHGKIIGRYSDKSKITFFANQRFTRLSSYVGNSLLSDVIPTEHEVAFTAGATWDHELNQSNALSLRYVYDLQTSTAASAFDVQTNRIAFGITHRFTPRFVFWGSAGPAWSSYLGAPPSAPHGRSTVSGTLALSREFRQGGVMASFTRSNSFSGVISDRFHNRYDFDVHRQLSPRLLGSVTASYLLQQISSQASTDGLLVTAELRYFLTPSWSLFTEGRYLEINGYQQQFAPSKSVIVGVRWSWVPERP